MGESYFVWDEISDGLAFHGAQKAEDDLVKKKTGLSQITLTSNVYCPHRYLILQFHDTLNTSEKIKFRRRYLRKITPNDPNIIILQDIKNLVLYLLVTPVSPQFINFLHLPVTDRFLRSLLIYFHHYIEIWESLTEERAATMKKAPNPLAQGNRLRFANEIRILRTILAKEYANLLLGFYGTDRYHHLMSGHTKKSAITQSQGEKDLRIFEALLNVAQRIIWIALKRKHFSVIEVELHRLFRTDAYNMADRKSSNRIIQDMLENDLLVLHGSNMQFKRKLLRNSPLLQELVYFSNNSRRLPPKTADVDENDPCVTYLKNALTIEEDKLSELGIKMGILGDDRSNYDITLMPLENKSSAELDESDETEKEKQERLFSIISDRRRSKDTEEKSEEMVIRMPCFGTDLKPLNMFLQESFDTMPNGYAKDRDEARRTWFAREQKRQGVRELDVFSIATTLD